MEKSSWKPIEDYLNQLDELQPLPTQVRESWKPEANLRACIFDIYGTLLISASGDIDQAEFSTGFLEKALKKGHIDINAKSIHTRDEILQHLLKDFRRFIEQEHARLTGNGYPHPEVVITRIWQKTLKRHHQAGNIAITKHSNIKVLALFFELMANKIYPMPGMQTTLEHLREKGVHLGIVSNAQFYTPMIMNFFLGKPLTETDQIRHFEPALSIFSYQTGRAKPDTALFELLKERLHTNHGISPAETLYVGNDMYKDIWPASQVGFKTALFAGDRRSLRLRETYKELRNLRPGFIIKDLTSLAKMIE